MENEQSSIHDFDINLICDYFSGLERQGPGSTEMTLKALSFIDLPDTGAHIADLGCGTGGQTMVLGRHTPARVTGVDLFDVFINRFNEQAKALGMEDRVRGVIGSMDSLTFKEESLDLIWSEGAIYNIGFNRGLKEWRAFIKPGGYLAVTEASWFTPERPEEINRFWLDAYPEIDTISTKIHQMENNGYIPVASFILPETCWTDNFYVPQIPLQENFLEKHAGNKLAEDLVENERREAQMYQKYKNYYGYVFYIGKKS